jgi:hypothetical protein
VDVISNIDGNDLRNIHHSIFEDLEGPAITVTITGQFLHEPAAEKDNKKAPVARYGLDFIAAWTLASV